MSNYAEQLAEKVFKINPDLVLENEILNIGYKIAIEDLPKKHVNYMFSYNEDFPADFISAYSWIKNNS